MTIVLFGSVIVTAIVLVVCIVHLACSAEDPAEPTNGVRVILLPYWLLEVPLKVNVGHRAS
jgi:hypothetical protein